MTNTINGIIPYDKYPSLADALKNVTTFVTEEDKNSNPYYDMRKKGSNITYHNPVPVIIPEMLKITGALQSIQMEYEAKLLMTPEANFDKTWTEYLDKLNKAGLQGAVDAAQKWYDSNK
jgi:hypothetical protein